MLRGTRRTAIAALAVAALIATAGPAAAENKVSIGTVRLTETGWAPPLNVEVTYSCDSGSANWLAAKVTSSGTAGSGLVRETPTCDGKSHTTTLAVSPIIELQSEQDQHPVIHPYSNGQSVQITAELLDVPDPSAPITEKGFDTSAVATATETTTIP